MVNEAKKRIYLTEYVGIYLHERERSEANVEARVKLLMETYQAMQIAEFQKRQGETNKGAS